jgi:uncharacterized protein (DUF952 family)
MAVIFHLIEPDVWSAALTAGMYAPASLAVEGFVHFSFAEQVQTTANRYYRDVPELVLLEVDPALLSADLRVETSGDHGDFPHVYGPVETAAVVAVHPMGRDDAGDWHRA